MPILILIYHWEICKKTSILIIGNRLHPSIPLLANIGKPLSCYFAILIDKERGREAAIIDVLVDGRKGGSVTFFTIRAPVYCTLYLHQLSFQSVRQERHFS
jgi:hypothetical protein